MAVKEMPGLGGPLGLSPASATEMAASCHPMNAELPSTPAPVLPTPMTGQEHSLP